MMSKEALARIAQDPEKALNDMAARRGLTREELQGQMDYIIELSDKFAGVNLPQGLDHLSWNKVKEFNESAELQGIFGQHVEECKFCQILLEGIKP